MSSGIIRKVIFASKGPKPVGPYREVCLSGVNLFLHFIKTVAHCYPGLNYETMKLVDMETEKALQNLSYLLTAADSDYSKDFYVNSQAVQAGQTVYVSGVLGLNCETMKLVEGGAVKEAEQALQNLGHILTAADSDYSKVVKNTVFLDNIEDFAAVNEVYKKYFKEPFPARSCFQVAKLPLGAKVEIETVALSGTVTDVKS